MLSKIKNCPLCKSTEFKFFSKLKKNLYSEILAKIINIREDILLEKIENNKCNNCDLIFKNYWFDDKILEKIYSNYIPTHPRGKDFKSNLFSKNGFKKEYYNLLKALRLNKIDQIKKHSRTIKSIIFSIPKYKKLKATNWITKYSRSFDESIDINKLKKNFNKIATLIKIPEEFKRFSGFESSSLWKYININVNIKSYAEIGCPKWGLLNLAKQDEKKIFFIKKKEKNFWGKKCLFGKKNCLLWKKSRTNFKILNLEKDIKIFQKDKIGLIGIFQYLDHIRDPLDFIEKLIKISNNLLFIVDKYKKFDNTIYIQHFTGWNKKSFNWAAKKFKKKLINNFDRFEKTENDLFLFV